MTRDELLVSIAATIKDYRLGEVPEPTPAHVDRWVRQFDEAVQLPLLAETKHVLAEAYMSEDDVRGFLSRLATNGDLTGGDHAAFWRGVRLLDIQISGKSQGDLLRAFDAVLRSAFGFGVADCTGTSGVAVYLDDGIFSGLRVRADIEAWLPSAPDVVDLHVIVLALHEGGRWHVMSKVPSRADALKKTLAMTFWSAVTLEDRRARIAKSDVLRPRALPSDPLVDAYAAHLTQAGFPPELRPGSSLGTHGLFSSVAGRDLLEREFLLAGTRIRQMCRNLPEAMRPLGFTGLHTLGFGSQVVTYRNCPNNCPLAFWVGHPWYPLLPRRTNRASRT